MADLGAQSPTGDVRAWSKLPCSCLASVDADGYMWVEATGFLCEAGHRQGDLVEVREGLAHLPGALCRCEGNRG